MEEKKKETKKMEEKKKETKELNIYQKMLKATEQIGRVAKNLSVDMGKNSYKAVSEKDVLEAVKPIEIELGIYSYPLSRKVIETNVLTTSKTYNNETKESNQLFMRIETIYRFINVDNPSEYIDVTTYGDGVDSQDKAPGKAMTYADKYALLKAYKIETGDDPDKEASGELKKVEKGNITKKITEGQLKVLQKVYTGDNLTKLLEANGLEKLEDMTIEKASELISKLKGGKNK